MGRPAKGTESGRSKAVAVRLRPEVYEQVKAAATKSNISLSAEIARRLAFWNEAPNTDGTRENLKGSQQS